MSTATPPASSQSPAPSSTQEPSQNASQVARVVLEYLHSRGYTAAENALRNELEVATPDDKERPIEVIDEAELVKTLAVFAHKPSRPGENVLKDSSIVQQELTAMGNPSSIQSLISSVGSVGAEEILSSDPTDKQEGFRELEAWVDGSLDMYRNDELAQRFRNEKFSVRMSRSGFSLLVGWLTEGVGGEAPGAGNGFSGERGKRGRATVMRVVNNHLRFDVTSTNPSSISPHAWEESTGLLSSLIPKATGSSTASYPHAQAFNASKGEIKLGPAPLSDDLRAEAERVLREQAMLERDPAAQYDIQMPRPTSMPGMVMPSEADLLPHPPSFKTVDVEREVTNVRDARKRIRLDPTLLANLDASSPQASAARSRALPSICAYTLHDVAEGSPCCTFSQDLSLMAAGFAESYIRLWSLKGEKLHGMRSDFNVNSIKDASSLHKTKEKKGSTTRKLIGHSGPVYSVHFEPVGGAAAAPKYLLSGSADATTRLWSMDTMTNVAVFRGHENPVWDVKWSPMGIYFATASRDRTARLWSTDRISCLRVYAGHLSDVDCLQFHPNSLYLATGSSDWTARLWDLQRGSCVRVFLGHQGAVSCLAISPDGRYLASAGEDLAVNLWDIGSGKRIKKMTGHSSSIYSLAFSGESTLLVSGGADCTVRCWDVKGPGGPKEKPRENGALSLNSDPGSHGYGEDENHETTHQVQVGVNLQAFFGSTTCSRSIRFARRIVSRLYLGYIFKMEETMEVDFAMPQVGPHPQASSLDVQDLGMQTPPPTAHMPSRDAFRDIQVKVHIRRPEKDSWVYMGRGIVTQELSGHSSRVGATSDLQAEKRGNFVVVGCVEGSRVMSWSLNALNNSETLRLLASIELACYRCKQALADPRLHSKGRRRIERVIKDDRRRRHRRRKDQDALIDAFAKQTLAELPAGNSEPPGAE
ncbi:hypothetical protein H0H93_015196 [Arthromyces matolae]|nr:hypothetical protein H0H93_015196 [Arthromyces matolae]